MYIRGEITYRGADAAVERATIREMPAETHSRGADTAIAGGKGEESGNGERGVLVVGRDFLYIRVRRLAFLFVIVAGRAARYLLDFVFVSGVCAGGIVGEGFRPGEFMVGGRRGDNVALTSYLPGKPLDGPSDLSSSPHEHSLMSKSNCRWNPIKANE